MRGPLEGVVVLDFTQYIAGPSCTRQMAEMGAEVIKVELAPDGDFARAMPVLKDGRSGYFIQWNQGKKSLCLDLRKPEALALVKRLLPKADVLVENFSPGVIGRLGLGWDVVRAINPGLVMCSISAFGQTGPLAEQPGFDFIAQAYTGVTAMIGEPDAAPPITNVAVGDIGAGISALAAINAALYWRRGPGGTGQHLDIALIDFYFHSHSLSVQLLSASGGAIKPERSGPRHASVAPVGVFKARQGYIMLVPVGQDMWRRLARAMGRADLLDDPRFAAPGPRLANRATLDRIIEDWLQAQPSDEAALATLQRARVPCAPVLSVEQAMREPHFLERGTVREVDDAALGRFLIPGNPVRFSAFPQADGLTAPRLGEHNAEVLSRLLGSSPVEIAALEHDGVLFPSPASLERGAGA